MNLLKDLYQPLTIAAIIGLCGWMLTINNRLYEFQSKYVTQAQLNETVRSLEGSIKETIQGEEGERQQQQAMFIQWLNRIEQQQMVLSADIKSLLKEQNNAR